MNKTENYQLNQWELTDRIRMEDFNGDNAKIDAALAGLAATVAAHQTAMPNLGNCQIYKEAYTGNNATSRTFTFPRVPWVVILCSPGTILTVVNGQNGWPSYLSDTASGQSASFSDKSLTLSCEYAYKICNGSDHSCVLIALMSMEE